MRTALASCLVLLLAAAATAIPVTTVLYDGSVGDLPGDQGWVYGTNPSTQATQTAAGGVTTLDTTAVDVDQAGYGHQTLIGLPLLDRATGYTIRFQLQTQAESHQADDRNADGVDDRGGFSVIAISGDLSTLGIEIAFWEGEIWAYDYADVGGGAFDFVHAEGAAFDPTAALTHYDLVVQGTAYELWAGSSKILSGALRDYSPCGLVPYNVASSLYFGDDTTKASSETDIAYIAHVNSPLPEPGALALLAAGCVAVLRRR